MKKKNVGFGLQKETETSYRSVLRLNTTSNWTHILKLDFFQLVIHVTAVRHLVLCSCKIETLQLWSYDSGWLMSQSPLYYIWNSISWCDQEEWNRPVPSLTSLIMYLDRGVSLLSSTHLSGWYYWVCICLIWYWIRIDWIKGNCLTLVEVCTLLSVIVVSSWNYHNQKPSSNLYYFILLFVVSLFALQKEFWEDFPMTATTANLQTSLL